VPSLGKLMHFERPDDASGVRHVDPLRRRGVRLTQPLDERDNPVPFEVVLQPLPHEPIARGEPEVVDDAGHVQPRATHQDRRHPTGQESVDHRASRRLIPGDGRLFGDVEHVEQVMRDPPPLRDRQLRRTDVHAAVELHGVCVHDLSGSTGVPESGRQVERQRGLPRPGRSDDREESGHRRSPSVGS
jgi:hypothetical protein